MRCSGTTTFGSDRIALYVLRVSECISDAALAGFGPGKNCSETYGHVVLRSVVSSRRHRERDFVPARGK